MCSISFLKLAILAPATLLLLGACGSKKAEKSETPVLKAYRLIDEQRTDEAIELMEKSLSQDPGNYEYKVVLSSAYAHKGGIKIQKLLPSLLLAEKLTKLNAREARLRDQLKKTPDRTRTGETNRAAIQVAFLLAKYSSYFDLYASIPTITPTQSTYVQQAIRLLNSLPSTIQPHDALYRAILEVVLFKHILAENLVGEFSPPTTKDEASCRLNLSLVNDTVIKLGKLLIDIYNDVGISNPKQAENMKQLSEETADVVSSLSISISTLSFMDDVAQDFLKQSTIQGGFGKVVRCAGR